MGRKPKQPRVYVAPSPTVTLSRKDARNLLVTLEAVTDYDVVAAIVKHTLLRKPGATKLVKTLRGEL